MQKRIGIVLALALTAAAIVTGTALAKPGSGTVITFDNGTLL